MAFKRMQDALERHVVDLIREAQPDMKTIAIGEPWAFPTAWMPLAVVFCRSDAPANDDGYAPQETMREFFAYSFYVSVEVAIPEAVNMAPDGKGLVHVPSYEAVKERIEAIRAKLNYWQNNHDDDRVIVFPGQPDLEEASAQIVMGRRDTGQENRGESWTQRALLEFVIYTSRDRR